MLREGENNIDPIEQAVANFQPVKRSFWDRVECSVKSIFNPAYAAETVTMAYMEVHALGDVTMDTFSELAILPDEDQRNAYRSILHARKYRAFIEELVKRRISNTPIDSN